MAIAVEGTPSYGNAAAATYTAETTGTDRLLVILVSCEDGSSGPEVTALSLGSASIANGQLVKVIESANTGGAGAYNTASIYYIKEANIPAGANAPTITYDVGAITAGPFFDYFTLSGVDQTTPVDDTAADVVNNVASSTTFATGCVLETNTTGGWAVALASNSHASGAHTAWDDFSEVADAALGGAYTRGVATASLTGASVTTNPTFTGTTYANIVAAAFKPSGGASTTRGAPFGNRSTAFNGGRVFHGPIN
jgi:hypothetical protein